MQPFDSVVSEHGAMVMRVCRALLGPVEADDAWSETFLAALRAYPELRPGSNVAGWLATIAHHKAIDQLRARQRRAQPAADLVQRRPGVDPGPEPADTLELVGTELHGALAELATKQRLAVVYRYLADLSYADVGALLKCSEAAARRNAADGIARLRRYYQKDEA